MTRSENMEHVEVLRHMKETIKAIAPSEVAALDAAIAALSAPQPPAEAQPVASMGIDREALRTLLAFTAHHDKARLAREAIAQQGVRSDD